MYFVRWILIKRCREGSLRFRSLPNSVLESLSVAIKLYKCVPSLAFLQMTLLRVPTKPSELIFHPLCVLIHADCDKGSRRKCSWLCWNFSSRLRTLFLNPFLPPSSQFTLFSSSVWSQKEQEESTTLVNSCFWWRRWKSHSFGAEVTENTVYSECESTNKY